MLRMLIAYSASSVHVQTTRDYLTAIKRYTDFDLFYVHVTHNAIIDFDLSAFDVVFHSYCARLCYKDYVSPSYCDALKRFRGLKLLAVQDEYTCTDAIKQAIKDLGFHVVLTCVPLDALEYVYPRSEFPDVEFVNVLTGYVPDHLSEKRPPAVALADRPIVVGYRGRELGAHYGQQGLNKAEIGRRMRVLCEARSIPCDIAMDEDSRIYGPAWLEFVGSCRVMLGTESGSNVFDFDGSLEAKFKAMSAELGRPPGYDEFRQYLAGREGHVAMGQISPRVFECALMRTPMVLLEGRYSDVIAPGHHYIALRADFSNVDEVFDAIADIPRLEQMAVRTYDDLVASERFGYRAFGGMLQALIRRRIGSFLSLQRKATVAEVASNQASPDAYMALLRQVPTKQLGCKLRFELTQHLVNGIDPVLAVTVLTMAFARIGQATLRQHKRLARHYQRVRDCLLEANEQTAASAARLPRDVPTGPLAGLWSEWAESEKCFENDRALTAQRQSQLWEEPAADHEIPNEKLLLLHEKRLQELLYLTKRFNVVALSAQEEGQHLLDELAACVWCSSSLLPVKKTLLLARLAVVRYTGLPARRIGQIVRSTSVLRRATLVALKVRIWRPSVG